LKTADHHAYFKQQSPSWTQHRPDRKHQISE
jgi:rRNA pseudouridine-1189 N-methylase Emg1 (Nep1/Mra1 family)